MARIANIAVGAGGFSYHANNGTSSVEDGINIGNVSAYVNSSN